MHVTDFESIRRFGDEFRQVLLQLGGAAGGMRFSVLEACAWMEICMDRATANVSDAEEEVDLCEAELRRCESGEDEDYIPDCSQEEAALEEAQDRLHTWRNRRERIRELNAEVRERRTAMLARLKSFREESEELGASGITYLSGQIEAMEEILRLRGPLS